MLLRCVHVCLVFIARQIDRLDQIRLDEIRLDQIRLRLDLDQIRVEKTRKDRYIDR